MNVLEGTFERMPPLTEVGIKRVVNGPITYTIDGHRWSVPYRASGTPIASSACAPVWARGGHGWLLAQQIVRGEAQYDTWVIDQRRFGAHATVELTALKAIEDYQNEFRFHFPEEHRPAGRGARTTPLTPILAAERAEFTVVDGWEQMEYTKPTPDFHPTLRFDFDETFDLVAAEVANVQTNVGLTEVNGANRSEIAGADRHAFLDRMFGSQVTKRARMHHGVCPRDRSRRQLFR